MSDQCVGAGNPSQIDGLIGEFYEHVDYVVEFFLRKVSSLE